MESRIKLKRTSLRMTRKDLASQAGVSPKSIQQYEDGLRRPSPGVLLNMAQALKVSVDWLNGETDDPYVDEGVRVREYSTARTKGHTPQVGYSSVMAYLCDVEPEQIRDMLFRVWLQRKRADWEEVEGFPKMLLDCAREMFDFTAGVEKGVDRLMEIQAEIDARDSQ